MQNFKVTGITIQIKTCNKQIAINAKALTVNRQSVLSYLQYTTQSTPLKNVSAALYCKFEFNRNAFCMLFKASVTICKSTYTLAIDTLLDVTVFYFNCYIIQICLINVNLLFLQRKTFHFPDQANQQHSCCCNLPT